jgi:AcrR family transcriptional regulator
MPPRETKIEIERDAALEFDLDAAWREIEPLVVRRLMIAAVQEFASRGYHGTTTRDIASRAGLSPAGVYVHFRSKEEVLYRISLIGHQHALAAIRAAASGTDEPVAKLRAVVGEFGRWHARHHIAARVINYEMGALTELHLAEIMALRRGIDTVVRETLEFGIEHRVLASSDVGGAALALLSLTIDVARWYRPEGPRTPDDIGTLYADLAERMLRP